MIFLYFNIRIQFYFMALGLHDRTLPNRSHTRGHKMKQWREVVLQWKGWLLISLPKKCWWLWNMNSVSIYVSCAIKTSWSAFNVSYAIQMGWCTESTSFFEMLLNCSSCSSYHSEAEIYHITKHMTITKLHSLSKSVPNPRDFNM